ncbi:MAG: amino acid transporter substrate-binding protein [Myxococcaceae bacterium]|nr:amino acid transporter substrate-binding protein [Myxococcaceae bacterium]
MPTLHSLVRSSCLSLLLALVALGPLAHAAAPSSLRVCADPNNLPFSNRKAEGLENKLAELLARELGLTVSYHWWPARRGYVRNTLKAGVCDVLLGVPRELDTVLTTSPYYRSSYVFVTRSDGPTALRSLDDPRLRTLRLGVPVVGDDYANPPPAHALSRRGIVDNVVGFSVFGDYAQPSPLLALVEAVQADKLDVAIAWGPVAGFAARRAPGELVLAPVAPAQDGPFPFVFAISLGVRKDDVALRDKLESALQHNRRAIEELLREYGVPTL